MVFRWAKLNQKNTVMTNTVKGCMFGHICDLRRYGSFPSFEDKLGKRGQASSVGPRQQGNAFT